jgi:hypothetical protein
MQGKARMTRFEGGLCVAIGLGWLVTGLVMSFTG